ncbi:MAG: hypothetical protein ACI9WC_002160 [Arenicella sp.]|jgi:hypothetical protein
MKERYISDGPTTIETCQTQNEMSLDMAIQDVPILGDNDVTESAHLLDKRELEALTSWTYFEPLQYR